MEERELVALIENEVASSIGGSGGGSAAGGVSNNTTTASYTTDLASERALELDYYNSRPFGNEREGESQVVSSDVFDAVEGMLPHLIKTFTASDDAVVFEPEGPEDEEAAKQRTDVCNYVFYRQNNGFVVMYEWFKDALIQKNGVVKYWWEEKSETTEESYQGLTEGEFLMLSQQENAEVIEHTSYPDPASPQGVPMMGPTPVPLPAPQLHDVTLRVTEDKSQICIKAIPPEEFGISSKHNCISIQDAPFVFHRSKQTISQLRAMGCPEDILKDMGGNDGGQDEKPEILSRNRFTDEGNSGADGSDDSSKEVWVTDCFIRTDYDGDGIAELRHIIKPGNRIWVNEPCAHINFAAITPIIMPHKFIGKSIAEVVMDVQFITSVLWRQMLNNLYLTNNPQKVVLGSQGGIVQADLDRLMTSRVGGILVEYQPNAIRNQEVPFVAGSSFPMLEYMQAVKENRTGNTRYNQGTDADSLNKTARGIQMIQNAAQQKLDLIARIFAETGVKDLFRGIAYFLSKYSTRKLTMRLRNKWVEVDPREWKNQFDMTVNVGLGTGNKDAQLVHLAKMGEVQIELMKSGRGYMVTDENVYNLTRKMAENMGFKHPDMFLTNPSAVQKPPPMPDPEILKLQQADAEAKMKIQSNEKIRQFDAQTQKELETIKSQTQIAIAQLEAQVKERIAQMQIQADAAIAQFTANNSLQGESEKLERKRAEVGYKESLLAIKKQVEGASSTESGMPSTQIIVDDAGAVTSGITELITQVANNVNQSTQAVQSNVDMTKRAVDELASQQKNIASTVASLAQKVNRKPAPRKHRVKKLDDGYEITTL